MEDAATQMLSYPAWRAEADHVSELAQRIAQDERLTPLLSAVMPRTDASDTTAADSSSEASVSFLSKLFSNSSNSRSTNADVRPAVPWCASLAQLLALAELPLPNTTNSQLSPSEGGFTVPGNTSSAASSSSSTFPAPRGFAKVIAVVANSNSNATNNSNFSTHVARKGTTAAEGHSLVSTSHAVLPMRVSHAASSSTSTPSSSPAAVLPSSKNASTLRPSTAFEVPQRSYFNGGRHTMVSATSAAPTRAPLYDGRDDEDEGDFDRMFARLKQQAAARSFSSPQDQPVGPATHPLFSSQQSKEKTSDMPSPSPSALTGLTAGRAALDAADLLLLRVRQQNEFSTTPSGRITEAQTLLLRAAVCCEAQLYTDHIVEVVDALLDRHDHLEKMREGEEHEAWQRQASAYESTNAPESHLWADSVRRASPDLLNRLLRYEFACVTPSSVFCASSLSAAPHLHSGSMRRTGSFVQTASPPGNGGTAIGSNAIAPVTGSTGVSPTSASSVSFYHVPQYSSATANASSLVSCSTSRNPQEQQMYLLPADLIAALHQWKKLVGTQQRALRCEEVHDYLVAARLFVGAAAERTEFGCDLIGTSLNRHDNVLDQKDLLGIFTHTPAADLASHSVTHLLRACGLLLSDPLLTQEVIYPASLMKEMEEMLATANQTTSLTAESEEDPTAVVSVIAPPLLATAHATRVWMILVQLTAFLERHRLYFPWDMTASSSSPAMSTPQMLWEVSVSVLLFKPADALRTMQRSVSYAPHKSHGAGPRAFHPFTSASNRGTSKLPVCASLYDLFHEQLHTSSSTTAEASSSPPTPPQNVLAQPGTLPLCLFSLRRASAAAVRTRHYADALRDVEIALYLIHSSTSSVEAEDDVGHPAVIDYRKVGYWSGTVAAATVSLSDSEGDSTDVRTATDITFTSTSACLFALTHFGARVHFLLLRVFLLLLTSPLTTGEAAAELLKSVQLTHHSATPSSQDPSAVKAREEEEKSRMPPGSSWMVDNATSSTNAAKERAEALRQSTSHVLVQVAPNASVSQKVATPVTSQAVEDNRGPRGNASAASPTYKVADENTRAANITALLRTTVRMFQDMTDQLRFVEQEGLILRGRDDATTTTQSTAAAAFAVPYVPKAEYRLSTVLRRAVAAARQGVLNDHATGRNSRSSDASDNKRNNADGADGGVVSRDSDTGQEISHAAAHGRRVCRLISSAGYRQLKHKYLARQRPPLTEEMKAISTRNGNDSEMPRVEKETAANALRTGVVEVDVSSTSQPEHEKETKGTESTDLGSTAVIEEEGLASPSLSLGDPSLSAIMQELQHLLHELLSIVRFLTLPLRAKSTCTAAQETAALSTLRNGAQCKDRINSNEEEGDGYDTEYVKARVALHTFAGRLERCLGQLGARDMTLFTLLRRLEIELLFPAVCNPTN